ncbi:MULTISPECIES: aspartyl protease family protein [unclassified Sphingomonas]|uniref:aspartyl protease family protein n=1 Tax=unclassified Sphingomonas TaxID=196159 RepID=UPI00226A61CF|nr:MULTISPECIES: aspartyl protease family protein [unclassified Sphingomonas]
MAEVQEVTSPLPDTFTNPPTFWMPDTGSVWIGFDPHDDHVVIPIVLNGRPSKALVDTGIDQLIVSKSYADAHHLPLTSWSKVVGFGGAAQYYTTPSVALDIGAFRTARPGAVTVVDLSQLTVSSLEGVDVVIGLPLLGPFEWQVDQDHHRFRLMKSGSVPVVDGVPIKVGPGNSRMVTNGSVNGRSVSLTMIDTGSDGDVSLSSRAVELTGFAPQTDFASIGVGGTVVQPLGRLKDFMIGTHKVTGAYATVEDGSWWGAKEIQTSIGMGVLRAYNMTVDLTAGQMKLEPRVPPAPPIYRSLSGIQGSVMNGRWNIAHVMRGSPAMTAGLKPKMAICAIDDKPVSEDLVSGYWHRAAPKTRHSLKLCDGSSRIITLRSFY